MKRKFTSEEARLANLKGQRIHWPLSFAERFWKNVHKTDGCWFWIGTTDTNGYGYFYSLYSDIPDERGQIKGRNGRMCLAHRVIWFLLKGVWPKFDLLHSCDTPQCVRPDHLFEGTQLDNMRDASAKGNMVRAGHLASICRHGHAREIGLLRCASCKRLQGINYRQRHRPAAIQYTSGCGTSPKNETEATK